jgi:hypothetical protein
MSASTAPVPETKKPKPFTADDFRAELVKIMPGYQWTVHRAYKGQTALLATGIQSSGFNRLSTLCAKRSIVRDAPWYSVKSAGFGCRAKFLHENGDVTLARALRGLQDHYESMANTYRGHALCLKNARQLRAPSPDRLNGGAA